MHIHREMLNGANEINEDLIQIDLLNGAGVVYYAGDAATDSDVSAEGEVRDEVVYEDFIKLGIELSNNRCPKQTTMITGSRMIDTRVVDGGYVMYCGAELLPTLKNMKDYHNDKAFIEAKHYADASTLMRGEIGSVDKFRIVEVPEMMRWEGAGGAVGVGTNPGYRETNGKYDIYPMLVIGAESFTTIGFQTSDGKNMKFKITHVPPKADKHDPYGESGFMSIKWYYGIMILRPERLALIKTVARM